MRNSAVRRLKRDQVGCSVIVRNLFILRVRTSFYLFHCIV